MVHFSFFSLYTVKCQLQVPFICGIYKSIDELIKIKLFGANLSYVQEECGEVVSPSIVDEMNFIKVIQTLIF